MYTTIGTYYSLRISDWCHVLTVSKMSTANCRPCDIPYACEFVLSSLQCRTDVFH